MRLVDLPRTGSFRLALLFLTLFGVASAVLFGFLYLQTERFLLAGIDNWLEREAPARFDADLPEVRRLFTLHAADNRGNMERIFVLYAPEGRRLAGDPLPLPDTLETSGKPFFMTARRGSKVLRYRGVARRYPSGEVAIIAENLHESREFDEAFISTAAWGALITAVLGLGGATIVGLGAVRRFDAVADAIQEIVRGDLSRRLPARGTSGDLDRLVHVVNGMLDDIERLMQDVKGVCDGIAHDLRTPLTRILAGLERSQRRAETREDYALAVDDAIVELRGVLRTFTAMLRIAELEDGARRSGFSQVDLPLILADVVDYYDPAAEEKGLTLTTAFDTEGRCTLNGDASLLFEAFANLIDNAIKFTPAGGHVVVELKYRAGGLEVAVRDTGCGIPAEEREAVFQRFYRAEHSRSSPGNGLGLTLVKAIAHLHNMTVRIDALTPGARVALIAAGA